MKHIIKLCNVKGCKEWARKWIDTELLSGDFDVAHRDTFYLCDMHKCILTADDDFIAFLNPETGRIRRIEIAEYSCSEDCEICNH